MLLASVGLFIAVVALVRNYNESNLPITLYPNVVVQPLAEIEASRSIPRLKELASTVMPLTAKGSAQHQETNDCEHFVGDRGTTTRIIANRRREKSGNPHKLVALQLRLISLRGEEPCRNVWENWKILLGTLNADSEVAFDACQGLLAAEKSRSWPTRLLGMVR